MSVVDIIVSTHADREELKNCGLFFFYRKEMRRCISVCARGYEKPKIKKEVFETMVD